MNSHREAALKKLICALFLMTAFSLTGCMQSSDCSREDVICVGLVTDTIGVEDYGLNQDVWLGIQNTKSAGVIQIAEYIESVDARDYEKNIAYFAELGYDIIITGGAGLRNETLKAADRYKDIVFIGINQPHKETRENLIRVNFAEDQMGFIAGMLAARTTRTGMIGAVCETSDLDSMWRYCEGFRSGARFADKQVRQIILYNDNVDSEKLFVDEEWGYKTAQTEIQRGVDVIFAAGGITAQGAIRAALEAQVKVIGAERNQAASLKESNIEIIASIYGDAQFEVERILRLLAGGNKNAQSSGRVKLTNLSPRIPETLIEELAEMLVKLRERETRTNVPAMKP